MSIRKKVVMVMGLLGMLVVVVMVALSYIRELDSNRVENLKRSEIIAQEVANHLGLHLEEAINMVSSISPANVIADALQASNNEWESISNEKKKSEIDKLNVKWMSVKDENDPLIVERTSNEVAEYLKAQQELFPGYYGEIFLTNKYGVMIASTGKLTTLAHQHKYWWQAGYHDGKGRVFIDDRGFDESVGDYVVGMVVPVVKNNEVVGMLKGNVVISKGISTLVKDFTTRYNGELQVVRSGGLFVSKEGVTPLSESVDDMLLEHLEKKEVGSINLNLQNKDVFIGYAPVEITLGSDMYGFGGSFESIDHIKGNQGESWLVAVAPDFGEKAVIVNEIRNYFLYTTIIVMVLVIITSILFGELVTRPIRKLAEAVISFGKGETHRRAEVKSVDEIGSLAEEFNVMADSLEKSQKELEQKVAQRTKELEDTLEDFYMARIGMQKDLKLGKVKEQNKKIKNRIDNLKGKGS